MSGGVRPGVPYFDEFGREHMICPECEEGYECDRDSVDVGVGILYGPWFCSCGWSERGTHEERQQQAPPGWYMDPAGNLHNIERVADSCARFGIRREDVLDAFGPDPVQVDEPGT